MRPNFSLQNLSIFFSKLLRLRLFRPKIDFQPKVISCSNIEKVRNANKPKKCVSRLRKSKCIACMDQVEIFSTFSS